MNSKNRFSEMLQTGAAVFRISAITMVICCGIYPLLILAVAQTFTPYTANGQVILNRDGKAIGSELLAQGFRRFDYFWPRPSAVQFNASAAGGSNLSAASPIVRMRAEQIIEAMGHSGSVPIPAELVSASGSGLDPHITIDGARFQLERVAAARGQSAAEINAVIEEIAAADSPFRGERLVNVLRLNLALDESGH